MSLIVQQKPNIQLTTYTAYRSGVKVSSVWMTVSGGMSSSLSVFQSVLSSDRM